MAIETVNIETAPNNTKYPKIFNVVLSTVMMNLN